MKLFTIHDQDRLAEARKASETRVVELSESLLTGRVNESKGYEIGDELFVEAHRLEKLMIVEAVSDQDFATIQKNFRSMLRAAGSIVKNLPGTDLAKKFDVLRTEGIELLNDLYDDVKDVEQGINMQGSNIPVKAKQASAARDKFAKTFADFAILFKGTMALSDLFSEDPKNLAGNTEMREMISSLAADDLLSVPMRDAFSAYEDAVSNNKFINKEIEQDTAHDDWFAQGDNIDWVSDTSAGEVPAGAGDPIARPKRWGKPKKRGFFSRLFGRKNEDASGRFMDKTLLKQVNSKETAMEKKFKRIVQKSLLEKSPGFAKVVNIPELINALLGKSFDHLAAVLGRFDDFVSSDVDVDFLHKVINKPMSVSNILKNVWDSFSSGTMGSPRRPVG